MNEYDIIWHKYEWPSPCLTQSLLEDFEPLVVQINQGAQQSLAIQGCDLHVDLRHQLPGCWFCAVVADRTVPCHDC